MRRAYGVMVQRHFLQSSGGAPTKKDAMSGMHPISISLIQIRIILECSRSRLQYAQSLFVRSLHPAAIRCYILFRFFLRYLERRHQTVDNIRVRRAQISRRGNDSNRYAGRLSLGKASGFPDIFADRNIPFGIAIRVSSHIH